MLYGLLLFAKYLTRRLRVCARVSWQQPTSSYAYRLPQLWVLAAAPLGRLQLLRVNLPVLYLPVPARLHTAPLASRA